MRRHARRVPRPAHRLQTAACRLSAASSVRRDCARRPYGRNGESAQGGYGRSTSRKLKGTDGPKFWQQQESWRHRQVIYCADNIERIKRANAQEAPGELTVSDP